MSPLWILLELRMMEVVSGDNWSCKMCKAPVICSPPTNQQPAFYRPGALPVTQPCRCAPNGESITFPWPAHSKLT